MQKSPHSKLLTKLAVNLSHLLNVTEDEYEKMIPCLQNWS